MRKQWKGTFVTNFSHKNARMFWTLFDLLFHTPCMEEQVFLGPGELQTLWNIPATEWGAMQSRHLFNGTERKVGRRQIKMLNLVQSVQLGIQMALIREVGLSYKDARAVAGEAAVEIDNLFKSDVPASGQQILYAVSRDANGKAEWVPITLDTLADSLNRKFGGQPWVILDVMHYVRKVCDAIAARDPKYLQWYASRQAKKN